MVSEDRRCSWVRRIIGTEKRHSPGQASIVCTRFDGDGKEMYNDIYTIDPDGNIIGG